MNWKFAPGDLCLAKCKDWPVSKFINGLNYLKAMSLVTPLKIWQAFANMTLNSVLAVFSLRFVFFEVLARVMLAFLLIAKKNCNNNYFHIIQDGLFFPLCLSDMNCPKVCFYSLWALEFNSHKWKQASFQKDWLLQKHGLPDKLPMQLFCPSLGMHLLTQHRSGHRMPPHGWHTAFEAREKQGCYCNSETGNTLPLVQKEFCP